MTDKKPTQLPPKRLIILKEEIQGVLCPNCGKVMVSWHRHDYRTCSCSNETMIDGGRDYLRFGGVIRPQPVRIIPAETETEPEKWKPPEAA